jgi:hypothetical protein
MMDKGNIMTNIKKSRILTDKLKNDLLVYYDTLNKDQINSITDLLAKEKILTINFLKSLKDREVMSFEDIKNNIEKLQRKKRINNEKNDEENKNSELSDLLINLNSI